VWTLIADESGPSATEYAIMLAMLILGSVGIIRSVGEGFRGIYASIANRIPTA
jgi:Flp pilus assembly pilin Flp